MSSSIELVSNSNLRKLTLLIVSLTVITTGLIHAGDVKTKATALKSKKSLDKKVLDENDKFRESVVKALGEAIKSAGMHHDLTSSKFRMMIEPSKDGWLVRMVILPETPGAELLMVVKKDGSVAISPGY